MTFRGRARLESPGGPALGVGTGVFDAGVYGTGFKAPASKPVPGPASTPWLRYWMITSQTHGSVPLQAAPDVVPRQLSPVQHELVEEHAWPLAEQVAPG